MCKSDRQSIKADLTHFPRSSARCSTLHFCMACTNKHYRAREIRMCTGTSIISEWRNTRFMTPDAFTDEWMISHSLIYRQAKQHTASCAYSFHFESLPIYFFIHTVSRSLLPLLWNYQTEKSWKKMLWRTIATVQIANVASICATDERKGRARKTHENWWNFSTEARFTQSLVRMFIINARVRHAALSKWSWRQIARCGCLSAPLPLLINNLSLRLLPLSLVNGSQLLHAIDFYDYRYIAPNISFSRLPQHYYYSIFKQSERDDKNNISIAQWYSNIYFSSRSSSHPSKNCEKRARERKCHWQ